MNVNAVQNYCSTVVNDFRLIKNACKVLCNKKIENRQEIFDKATQAVARLAASVLFVVGAAIALKGLAIIFTASVIVGLSLTLLGLAISIISRDAYVMSKNVSAHELLKAANKTVTGVTNLCKDKPDFYYTEGTLLKPLYNYGLKLKKS